ncbi:MAG: hypothetical protein R3344_00990 [Acidobacteriota bacterium]|nr:hypothetical protein [Acidobacteriota bacterium]
MGARKGPGAIAVVTLFLACGTVVAGGGEVNLFYGVKNVDLEDFGNAVESDTGISIDQLSDLEELNEVGLLFTYGHDWPVALAVDLLVAGNDITTRYSYGPQTYGTPYYYSVTAKLEYDTWEVDVGIRKFWGGKVQFYLGTGLAFGNAEVTVSGSVSPGASSSVFQPGNGPSISVSENEKASDWGLWANTGVVGRLGKFVNLGVDVRFSSINVDLGDSDDFIRAPAGGLHYGLYIGGRW